MKCEYIFFRNVNHWQPDSHVNHSKVCLVRGEIEQIENRREKSGVKTDFMGVLVVEEGMKEDGKLVGLKCFLSWLTKISSLQFREKIERKEIVTVNDYMSIFI